MVQQPSRALMPLDEALAQLLACAHPSDATESLSTFDADTRVLAADSPSTNLTSNASAILMSSALPT